MNGSLILRSDELLNGAHVANVRLRPLRLGFLVPNDDARIAVRVIESCSLTWGGYCNPIIPYSAKEGLTEEWKGLLQVLDPDDVVDCVGISATDERFFQTRRQHVHQWKDPLATFFTVGALQYSALNAFGEFLKKPEPSHKYIIADPLLDENDALYLPLIARFGKLRESFLEETLRSHGWNSSVKYSDFAQVKQVDFSSQTEDILLGMTPTSAVLGEGGGNFSYRKLIDLTLLGLKPKGAAYTFGGGTPERPQFDEGYASCIIITGAEGSITDLAFYWNFRIERQWAYPFPLWIPLGILDSDIGEQILQRALGWLGQREREGLANDPNVYVLSASVSESELTMRLRARYPKAVIRTNKLYRFLTGQHKFDLLEEQREVHFNNGRTRVPLPKPEAFQRFAPYDRVICDIGIDGVRLPQSKSLQNSWSMVPRRITQHGTLEQLSNVGYWPDLVAFGIPDGWTILTCLFEDYGYECTPSDKGRMALGQLVQLGGIEEIGVFASSKVHKLLMELSRARGRKKGDNGRTFFAERPTKQFSTFAKEWGKQQAEVLVRWLVEKRILFRGAMLKCPVCQLKRWYEIDKISEVWRCEGCQTNLPIPLQLNTTQWAYRVNELYARGHDQGTVSHLLAMFNLHPPSLLHELSIIGYYPGILLTAKKEASVPVDNLEIDLVSIRDGKLIIVECKDSGETLTAEEVSRLVDVANHIQCSRLLFITLTKFPQANEWFPSAQERCTARVEWWEAEDVFDASLRERMGSSAEQMSAQERANSYLARLVRRLSSEEQ